MLEGPVALVAGAVEDAAALDAAALFADSVLSCPPFWAIVGIAAAAGGLKAAAEGGV